FSAPVGKLQCSEKALEDFSVEELHEIGIVQGSRAELVFESGIKLSGQVMQVLRHENKIILITFEDCTVKESSGNVLFQPEWGVYDMAVGAEVVSVFNGAADKDAYEEITHISEKQTHRVEYDLQTQKLHNIYQAVRTIREEEAGYEALTDIVDTLKSEHNYDWLCAMEILEILYHKRIYPELEQELRTWLEFKAENEPDHKKLIVDGLHVIENPVTQLITEEEI
ncbi:MAG: phenylalanine 4-monooxygenase, partial [Pedobacter sp.]|nr:phenylalanine 4-monooxygenase [Pedobacter sp.]